MKTPSKMTRNSGHTSPKSRREKTLRLTQLAIFTALVILLQLFLGSIQIGPTSFSVVLVPIVIGAILLGKGGGAFLGFVFGLVTLLSGVFGRDLFTSVLFTAQPIFTAVICLVKGTAAGFGAGLVYELLTGKGKHSFLAALLAAMAAPILNTGLFILGGLTLVRGTLEANLSLFGASDSTVVVFLVIGCAGWNFIVEFLVNTLLSPAIHRVITVVAGRKTTK